MFVAPSGKETQGCMSGVIKDGVVFQVPVFDFGKAEFESYVSLFVELDSVGKPSFSSWYSVWGPLFSCIVIGLLVSVHPCGGSKLCQEDRPN